MLLVDIYSQFYEDPLLVPISSPSSSPSSSSSSSSSSYSSSSSLTNNIKDYKYLAEQYYKTGMDYAQNKNDFTSALANLRAAVRLNPNSEIYQNDLGVSEMRVGQLHKAKKRFIESLKVNKYYDTAQENIDDIKAYMGIKEYMKGLLDEDKRNINRNPNKDNIKHTLLDINEISPSDFIYYCNGILAYDSNDFCDKTDDIEKDRIEKCNEIMSMPFIIRDAASVWGWDLDVFKYETLLSSHSNVTVDYYPQGMSEETVKPFFSTLSEAPFLPTVPIFHVDASLPGTYIQWNVKVTEWDELMSNANATIPSRIDDKNWMDQCLITDEYKDNYAIRTHWKMILIGEKGAGMFNHKDTLRTSSWQMQVEGRKKWHLCPNTESPLLGNAGEIDVFQPDYDYYPNAWKLECYRITVEPGDFIYYPKDYWHQTLALDTPTVSISGTMVDEYNYPGVTEELKKECIKKEGKIFISEKNFCQQLEKCYNFWLNNFN